MSSGYSIKAVTYPAGLIVAGAATVAMAGPHGAAPHGNAAAAPTLSFAMTARFAMRESGPNTDTPEQTVSARVYVDGKRIRAESTLGDRQVVYLYTPPLGYKLLPGSRTGLRYHIGSLVKAGDSRSFDPQTLLPLLQDPGAIRSSLRQQGARHAGSGQVQGAPVDVYTASRFRGQPVKVKAWLRRSDALPARLELASKKLTVVASWRNYQRGMSLSKSLFTVPAGYHIRDAHSEPPGM